MSRRTTATKVRVACALMQDPYGRHYGYPLVERVKVRAGTLYPMLDQMVADGWLDPEWELPDEITAKRPRRYYTLTNRGREELGALADQAAIRGWGWVGP